MDQESTQTTTSTNGSSTAHDLFLLTDEQILEIEPEPQDAAVGRDPWPVTHEDKRDIQTMAGAEPAPNVPGVRAAGEKPNLASQTTASSSSTGPGTRNTEHVTAEPPPWLAAQMKDPWSGEEARELWNGVQQARQEAAAYRAAIASPEDARALKELYPGGVNEARAVAERARVLDDFDRAYFGTAGKSAQEVSASREHLAQQMLHENPAAFREMVFAGLRALENSPAVGATLGSPGSVGGNVLTGGANSAPAALPANGPRDSRIPERQTRNAEHGAHLVAYSAFEKAANEDLERSVGGAIERTLAQALPNVGRSAQGASGLAGQAPPLQARLSQAIRQDVEAALKGDRQLGEQVAQILSARRLDEETRAQVVRLIGERAQQLVPVAAKSVLNDWTQATLASHRSGSARTNAASTRREVVPAASSPVHAQAAARERGTERSLSTNRTRPLDYRKLSDEQILDL